MRSWCLCQAERLSATATGERLASTEESCHGNKHRGQELPRGIVVSTTDLQMRSLYIEDEKAVSHLQCKIAESDFVRLSITNI